MIKKPFIFILLLFSKIFIFGQINNRFFFNEFQFSINKSFSYNIALEGKTGLGLMASHVFDSNKKNHLVFGIGITQTHQIQQQITFLHIFLVEI